jgi:hypothetical protein
VGNEEAQDPAADGLSGGCQPIGAAQELLDHVAEDGRLRWIERTRDR